MNDNQNREKLNMQEQETITIRNLATGYKGKHKTHIVARDINASIYAGEPHLPARSQWSGKVHFVAYTVRFPSEIVGRDPDHE